MATVQGVLSTLKVGTHDDGSADGVRVTKQLYQGLVKLPIFEVGNATPQIVTGASGTATTIASAIATNQDGQPLCYNLTVPALTSGADSAAWIETTLHGPRIGVRFRRNNAASLPPFTLTVDGVPYAVRQVANRRLAATLSSASDYEALFLVADDLGPGPHTVRVSVAGDVIGGASRTLIVYGWLVDRQAGYEDKPRGGFLPTAPTVLTTSPVTIPFQGSGLVKALKFHNTDAVNARFVTVTVNGGIYQVVPLAAGAAGQGSGQCVFDVPVNPQALSIKWQADAGAVVNGWALEAL